LARLTNSRRDILIVIVMQPQNPSRPVMDVRVPARPAAAPSSAAPPTPLLVHEAPVENAAAANPLASSADAPRQPIPTPEASHSAQASAPKPSGSPAPAEKPRPPLPAQNAATTSQARKPVKPSSAGIIVATLICMMVLAAIAIFIYLKSQ